MSNERAKPEPRQRLVELAGWLSGFALLTLIIPGIIIILLPQTQRADGIATWVANPILEYLSVSIGIGLGLNPFISFILTFLPCTGLAMLVIGLLGFLGDASPRASKHLNKIQIKMEKYPRLKKYGVFSNFIFIMILGVYISPGISVILGWSRVRSIIFMAGGIAFITTLIGLGTMGIIDLFFV
jgi:hypothetical protein